jgi:hypothetical protein
VKESLEVHTKAIHTYAMQVLVLLGAQPCSIFSTERTSAFEMKYLHSQNSAVNKGLTCRDNSLDDNYLVSRSQGILLGPSVRLIALVSVDCFHG